MERSSKLNSVKVFSTFFSRQYLRVSHLFVIRHRFAFQQLIGVEVLLLRKLFVEDKSQDVIPVVVGTDLSPQ